MKTLAIGLALLLGALNAASATCPTATIDSGPIFGATTELPRAIGPVNKFLGIPFAAPPERFRLPRRPKPWTSPMNTTAFGAACIQYLADTDIGPGRDILDGLFNTHPPESEDCLYMNAFAPATPGPPSGRPVVVFIPGGGWEMGSGLLDLSGFAGYEDIVAFTFNYRTNIFGFPNAPEFPVEQRNLGLHDQRLALEWVTANARAFGGDPAKVTIWGESAGSMSVDIHMHAYAHKPPFRAAIMSSGQMSFGELPVTAPNNDSRSWDGVAHAVGCAGRDRLSCMRRVPAEKLLDGLFEAGAMFLPVVDNETLPSGRAAAWREGRIARVPLLMTSIAQEGRSLVNHNITMARFLDVYLPKPLVTEEQRQAILSLYRSKPGLKTDFDVAAAIYTDFLWQCILANVSASIGNPVWRGYFNASMVELLPDRFRFLGTFHGTDVVLLFGTPTFEGPGLTPQLYAFANYFRGVIARFVRNPEAGPGWPEVGSAYAPFDVAVLGDVGGEPSTGPTLVNQTQLDANCAVYKDIFPRIDKYLP